MDVLPPLPAVGIVGFGNMGEALAAGLLKTTETPPLMVLENQSEAKAKALMQYKIPVAADLAELFRASQIIVIAVKPQDLANLVDSLARLEFASQGKSLISIAAGVKIQWFSERLKSHQIVRFMPNLAAKVGASLVGVSASDQCGPQFVEQAERIAMALGDVAPVPEKLLAAVTGISGSGLAFAFRFLHAMAMGGVREGLGYQQALKFALATTEGAVKLLRESSEHPIAFESKVCSPAGTTVEGVRVLEEAGMSAAVMNAVSAASRRAAEFEG